MAVRALPLAKALSARGHQCEVLLPPWSCPEDAGRQWQEAGVSVHNIKLPRPIPLLGHVIVAARLLLRILQTKPTLIHCFKPKGYSSAVAWALFWIARFGLIRASLVVDADDWEGPGGWNDREPYPSWQKAVFAWQERWGFSHCDILTVASRALQTIAWSLGVPSQRVHYVPNGFAQERVPETHLRSALAHKVREQYKLGTRPVMLLYSRFWDFDLARLVRIVLRVFDQIPDARLLVVGEGLHGEEKMLQDLVREKRMEHAVAMTGWVPAEELPAYFAAVDVALFPLDDTLINRARCSVKLADLLAAGVPVVAEAVGQNTDYIEDGRSGFLVPPGDEQAFAAAIVNLLSSPDLRTEISRSASEAMRSCFSWAHLAEQVEAIYASIPGSDSR